MKTGISGAVSTLTFALVLSLAAPAGAQEKVGVVTTVVGPVTVARASLPSEPLKFKRVLATSAASAPSAVAHQPVVGAVNSVAGVTIPLGPSASSAPSAPGVAAVPVSAVSTSVPVQPVVAAPAPAPVPTSVKTTSPNWGSSWKHASSKYDREDRSGSNSGKR